MALFHHRLLERQLPPAAILVVMEATSTYWIALAAFLNQVSYVVSVINPTRAHHFAKAQLKRVKNDALDAQILAQLARDQHPLPWTPPPPIDHQLQQRLAQRASLVQMRQQHRNHLHALSRSPFALPSVSERTEQVIATITAPIQEVESELAQIADQETEWSHTMQILQSIPGIGLITAS